jgi:transketolase
MRKEFVSTMEQFAHGGDTLVFLTGDLGFMALENLRDILGNRFVNVGVNEQNMMSMAAAMAHEGLQVICYSIAPFAVFRPVEQIRLDICLHKKNVKIVGNGGGYGYGIMGATHHAIEDIAVLSAFQNMHCYIPFCNEDVENVVKVMLNHTFPSYLRLGFATLPPGWDLLPFAPIRRLARGNKITVVGMGSVLCNIAGAIEGYDIADIFSVSEIPLTELSEELKQSIVRTKKLLVVEEHTQRGGLGEHLALHLALNNISCQFTHRFARGYENGLYGSQKYHQKQCGLDTVSLKQTIQTIING